MRLCDLFIKFEIFKMFVLIILSRKPAKANLIEKSKNKPPEK